MAIILWVGVIGFGLEKLSGSNTFSYLFVLAVFIPLPFWYFEATYRKNYEQYFARFRAIRTFPRDGKIKVISMETAHLKDFLTPPQKNHVSFPVFDYWANITISVENRKKLMSISRSLFNYRLLWLYYPMTIISVLIIAFENSIIKPVFFFIPLGVITLFFAFLSLKLNKRDVYHKTQ